MTANVGCGLNGPAAAGAEAVGAAGQTAGGQTAGITRDPAGQRAVAEPVGRQARVSTSWSGLATGTGWPISLVLAVQAVLSLRLIWSNTAFADEALYVWAGRVELAHLIHGSGVPGFASYFSGSPVLYPPVAALAAAVGGLAGARLLSLALMLTATALLHGVTRRLFDRQSAFFAAALFAGLAGTQFLGALATYDALALCLLALAAWLAVLASAGPGRAAVLCRLAAAAALALANGTKYASLLFDPVVLGLAVLAAGRLRGRDAAIRAGGVITAGLVVLIAAATVAAGPATLRGVVFTTLGRQSGSYPAATVLLVSGKWLWPVASLAALGVLAAATSRRGRQFALLAALLAIAVVLAPAEQARIHTYTSLFKHDDYGAWFGCAVAGYGLASLSGAVPRAKVIAAFRAGVVAVALAALAAVPTAGRQYSWPNSTRLIADMHRIIAANPGPVLADDDGELLRFYLEQQVSTVKIVGTWYISYRGPTDARPRKGLPGYADALRHGYFSVVMLEFVDNRVTDRAIERDVIASGRYRLAAAAPGLQPVSAPGFMVYVRAAGS